MRFDAWKDFVSGDWCEHINVRDFINKNYTPYVGDADFLAGATERTKALNAKLKELQKLERERGGVLSIDTSTVSSLCNYPAGYIDKDNEIIVGLQTDEPLKRGVNPFGGIRMARSACEAYGYKLSDKIEEYSIKIEPGKKDDKCFSVEITDQRLIDKTGGIVQGMSGSPIVQNGKLIGAITHVLINDPCRGYGIYIENMLKTAG